ncbi:hypothetical protein [Thiolapillus sp.]|uniref:hypothetical protein n=1 Tax=Thiolapillus sp. TaxID=2017437 RepID=UPI003AF42A4E
MIAEFAQIVGLVSAFVSGREASKALDMAEFLQWLSENNHQDIKRIVEQNHTTTTSIKALLNHDLEDIKTRLEEVSNQIAALSGCSDDLGDLAKEFATKLLSDQAIEILDLMDKNQTEFFLLSQEVGSDKRLILVPGPNYLCKERHFLQDDLELMLSLGLLRKDYNSNNQPMYYFTRAASNLVKTLSQTAP